jgi:ABC-type Fe3+-hydroxamate transport system, periplasmic component
MVFEMKRVLIVCISIICILSSCSDNAHKAKNGQAGKDENLMKYTSYINITNYKSGYYVNVTNPWNDKSLGDFYLYPDSLELPDELADKSVIRTPVKSAVTYSSTQWSVFLELGEMDRVKGILETEYTDNPEVKRLLAEGKVQDVGNETNLKTEIVINMRPDVILYTPYSTVPKTEIGQLTGAVMFPFADYLENHPLGRAEWLKVIGYLTCREKDTDLWFDGIVSRYESLKNIYGNIKNRPTVFSDLPFEGQWYLPGGNSYIAQIFHDAGADYIWQDNTSTASLPVDAETVLSKAGSADFWRVMNSTGHNITYKSLAAENELYTYFKAFKDRHIIVCDIRKSGYFEKSEYEPDILLKDFVFAFHPEMMQNEDYSPKYFYILKDEK